MQERMFKEGDETNDKWGQPMEENEHADRLPGSCQKLQESVSTVPLESNSARTGFSATTGVLPVGAQEPIIVGLFLNQSTSILRLYKQAGLHTTLDTCGHARLGVFLPILDQVDLVLFDFKHMDPIQHEKLTGLSNEWILQNLKRIHHEMHIPLLIRIPVMPALNDSIENIAATARFVVEELNYSLREHLLPYHRMGETKYKRLERTERSFSAEPPSDEHIAELQKVVESYGSSAVIGG